MTWVFRLFAFLFLFIMINEQLMKSDNVIESKSFEFAIRIIRLYKYLMESKKEFVLSKQILRSGTSIGANISEGLQGMSKKDFIAKMSVSLKEAQETSYWLRLLNETEFINETEFKSLHAELIELIKILTSILKTSRGKINTT